MAAPPTDLRSRPFGEQIAAIDAAIARGDAAALVAELVAYRDHQPLAHALAALARGEQLDAIAPAVARQSVALPDTSLRRVLRALANTPVPPAFTAALAEAARGLGVDRVAAAAMIDRWLKNVAPAVRASMIDEAIEHCRALAVAGRCAEMSDAALFRLPGTLYAELADTAAAAGAAAAWTARIEAFADAVLDALEAQPKSLSQANAEELLSRQVYTDPGHFLIELLQNADDAGATTWRVRVEPDRVEVEHDGVPFDARDVVGILSIGQTTKSKEQIGFFGVGFKSVYDICERPQIYSGPFAFEIANVSVPRPLAPRADRAPGHTLLVLPLRDPADPERSPRRLFERLAELPGEVLLTLNSLQEIDVHLGDVRHRVTTTAEDAGRVLLREQDLVRPFLLERGEARYGRARDANRSTTTPLLVAIALDDGGRPAPIGARPTVYSFLPTGERSGLRFAVHAHFDLPVDRERLDASSPWNAWALGELAPLLARALNRLVGEWRATPGDSLASERLDAAIDVIPLPDELGGEAYRSILAGLDAVELWPGAGGERLAAARALIAADDRLVRALAGVDLDGKRVVRPLDARAAAVARALGASSLAPSAVVDRVVADAAGRSSGAPFDPPWASSIAELAAALGASGVDLSPLAAVACLPDADGRARRPDVLARAGGALRALLAPLQPLVADALEAPECAAFLDRLGVARATTRDLVAALSDPDGARRVIDTAGLDRVLDHLAGAAPADLIDVELAAVALTDRGALCAIGEAFLTGDTPLAALVRAASVRPPLVAAALESTHGATLARLGAPQLDLRAAIELVARGHLAFAPDELGAVHRAIDAERDAISPALGARIARAPIFASERGALGALVGGDPIQIPADPDIRDIWPDRPWLVAEVASLAYVGALGVEPVGASAVARALLAEPPSAGQRRAAFAYLARHPGSLSAEMVAALASAPLWPDIDGTPRPLDALRRPSAHAAVARLYELWPRAMTVEPGDGPGTVMHLAAALDIAHHVVAPDLATALDDLAAGADELDLDAPAFSDAVTDVLLAAAAEVPRARLDAIRHAPIFTGDDGVRRALGTWAAPAAERVHRVSAELRAAFGHGRFPLLAADEARRLARLLDALELAPGTAADLVGAVDVDGDGIDAATAAVLRRALVASRGELIERRGELGARLDALAMWPTARGLVAASGAVRRGALRGLVGDDDAEWAAAIESDAIALVDEAAEADAVALDGAVVLADPVAALAAAIGRVARAGEGLGAQPPVLSSPERVAVAAIALIGRVDAVWSLPVAVDAAGRLVARELLAATPDELAFATGLPIHERLADPAWASAVIAAHPDAVAAVAPRQIVADLYEASREPVAAAVHACLSEPSRRGALYGWLIARGPAIAADEQARGALGKACVVLSEHGVLRAPRELMFDPALPDLGIDWNPAAEVPAALCAQLREAYRPAAKQLRPLLDHMMDALDAAIGDGDGDRVAELLHHVARVLRAGDEDTDLDERVRRFKLRKRLRVETSGGGFERPRRLLAPDARDGDLLARFADPHPASVSLRYRDDAVLALCRAAGAERELGAPALIGYLDGRERRAGDDAVVALACYVASAADRAPALRRELDLDGRAWMSDATGAARRAGELYWPGDGVVDLIGDDPHRLVHPEIVHRAPGAADWSGARSTAGALLTDVADHAAARAAAGTPISDAAVFWLDEQLGSGAVKAAEVRDALGELRVFADDHGRLRPAGELVVEGARRLFGDRRGDWSTGARATRLASALRIPRRPGKREVLAFLDEVRAGMAAGDDGVARDDSDLIALLPRCLDVLVEAGGRGPQALPVAVQGADGSAIAVLPRAASRVGFDEADDEGDAPPLVLLWADGASREAWRAYLRAYGIGPAVEEEGAGAGARERGRAGERERVGEGEGEGEGERAQERDAEEPAGILSRLRRWFAGDDEDDDDRERAPERERDDDDDDDDGDRPGGRMPPPGSPGSGRRRRTPRDPDDEQPFARVDQRAWFRGNSRLDSQLESNPAWLADRTRAAEFGLAHAPAQLPLPYRYAPVSIFGAFDRSRQSWRRLAEPAAWRTGGAVAGRMQLRGKLPAGEAIIPVPLFGRVAGHDQREVTRLIGGDDAAVAFSRADVVIAFDVELHEAPDFGAATAPGGAPAELLEPTVSDQELPVEVHDFLASLASERDPLTATQLVRSFVRERYVYDPTYLENAEVAAWLRQRTQRRSNVHIAALHAGRDTDHLGRGVCYELNALVCELLRRAGIPCAVATGWTFDRGYVDEPDHMWAMALLEAGDGPRWLPVDASTTRTGRPLHAASRPPGPWRASRRKAAPPREPLWSSTEPERRSAESIPLGDLLRVARHIERTTDTHLGTRAELLAACRALLSDPEAAAALAELLTTANRR